MPEQRAETELERGRHCYERRAWADAFEALLRADVDTPLGIDDLERLGWSAGLAGHDEAMLDAVERLYRACCEAGEAVRAARAAFWAGFRLSALREPGRANGWFVRAQRLVDPCPECAERGYLLLPLAQRHLATGEYDAARATAESAAEIGGRFSDPDLVMLARNVQAQIELGRGQLDSGLALLDEGVLAARGGDLSPVVTGIIYCGAIEICQRIYALDRAREWTSAFGAWCAAQPQLAAFSGACLVHRAEILRLGGAWPQAIEEARRAAERITSEPEATADAFYEQAEIHRLRGETAQAEEAYRQASRRGRDPQPGLALLRLAQGRCELALTAIRRVVRATAEPLDRARLLPAVVEITVRAGDLDDARAACEELAAIAAKYEMEALDAMAAHARGAVLLADGDASAALAPLRRSFRIWHRLGAPYVAAKIRLAIARACRGLGDDDGAVLELGAAREVFERLGAAPDVQLVEALRAGAAAPRCGLTARELEVLHLVATGKTNKAVARALYLSEKTIDRHVSNIFAKLGVASRAAATAYAYEHGLVPSGAPSRPSSPSPSTRS